VAHPASSACRRARSRQDLRDLWPDGTDVRVLRLRRNLQRPL